MRQRKAVTGRERKQGGKKKRHGKKRENNKRTDLIVGVKFTGVFFHKNKTKHSSINMSNMNE